MNAIIMHQGIDHGFQVFERRIQYDGEGAAMTDCKLSDSNPTQTCTIPVKVTYNTAVEMCIWTSL